MIKHMVTLDCPRSCPYCITRDVPRVAPAPARLIPEVYATHAGEELMLTGGEPTLDLKRLTTCLNAGRAYFKHVYLTTQNARFLGHWLATYFDAIVYSIHEADPATVPLVPPGVTAYAAIIGDQYRDPLPGLAKRAGFSGLTINEEHRGGDRFDATRLPDLGGWFTYRINRRGDCFDHTFLTPDLKIFDFSKTNLR